MTHPTDVNAQEHDHPSEGVYIRIAIILAIVTLVEVAIYYVDWMHDSGALVPTLIALSIGKFVAVVGYFMHLKFDDRRLLWVFVAALVVGLSVFIALDIIFRFNSIEYATGMLGGE